ncbi:MAG: ABC-2 type transport system permease protein [Chlamydiales bacterium]|jgi:ABC-2 type transport system permease protein
MSKFLVVVRQEYQRAVRSKAFIAGLLFMPLLMFGMFAAIRLTEDLAETDDKPFVVIDRTGMLFDVIEAASSQRNDVDIWSSDDEREQEDSRFLPELASSGLDAIAEVAIATRVSDGDLAGYLILGADLMLEGGDDRQFSWFTDKPTYRDLPRWLNATVNSALQQHRIAGEGLDQKLIQELMRSENLLKMGLPELSATGELIEAEEVDDIANQMIPMILAMMLYMLLAVSAPALLNNILEEKIKKISEVLLSSVSPFQLLMGKLMATVLVSSTLSAIYLGAGLAFAYNVDGVPTTVLTALRPEVIVWFFVFLVMGLVIFGSMFSALGAACSELQDAQTMMMPAMGMLILPVLFLGMVIESPNGLPAQIASFVPPATPVLMMLRVCVPPGVEIWELLLAVFTTSVFALGCVFVASKIFRVGILAQGQAPSYRKLIGWVFSK